MPVLDPGPYQRIRCDEFNYPVCQLICRKFGCQHAYHAKCFTRSTSVALAFGHE